MRLGHFPTPFPDELLYSVCARYSARVRYSNARSVLEELFGTINATAVIDLPNNLDRISAGLPHGSSLTPEYLINQHTLLPYFSAFLPRARVVQLKGDMRSRRGQAGYMRSGLMASRIPTPGRLRFCPICKREDEGRFGETYWRRVHQISGVEVCPIHRVFLEGSDVSRCGGRNNSQFITAGDATRALPPRPLDFSDHDHQVLLQIAHDVAWLLEHPSQGSSLEALHNRYLRLLTGRRLATYTGSIHVTELLAEFLRYYSATLRKILNCQFGGSDHVKTNWLLRLVRLPKHALHPLYHLLLMQFLGCNVAEFFLLPGELSFFGEGPWPCLNPAAGHYKEAVVQECKLSPRVRDNRPEGTFSCACGFSYARSGPDSSPEDRFRIGRIVSFGGAWEVRLKELWDDTVLSLSEVGRQLCVDPLTVRRHAERLNLPISFEGRRTKPLSPRAKLKSEDGAEKLRGKRKEFRSKWLSMMKRNNKITMKSLRKACPQVYVWLVHNNYDWLKSHRPKPVKSGVANSSVNWKKRDARYVILVKQSAVRIRSAPGRPVRITKTAIGRDLGALSLFHKHLHKLPLTSRILAGIVESSEEYSIRRIWWAAYSYIHEGLIPRRWQLVDRANVYMQREAPRVCDALQAAMKLFNFDLSLMRGVTA